MLSISLSTLTFLFLGLVGVVLASLVLGFYLGYFASRIYSSSAKTALRHMGDAFDVLKENPRRPDFDTPITPRIQRSEEEEADLEQARLEILMSDMTPEQQAQAFANAERRSA